MDRQNRLQLLPGPNRIVPLAALIAALFAAFVFTSPAAAVLIVNDTWQDGTDDDPASPTYSENGTDSDTDGDIESAWFQGGDGTLNPTAAGGPLRGQFSSADSTSSATWTTYFTPEASPVTLANPGERIRVTWIFTPTNINGDPAGQTSNTSQNFRLALVNSPAASRLAANGSPGSATYTGYGMFMNMGAVLGNSNPFQLREHDNNGALLSGSGDWLALANGATSGNTGYASGTEYTFIMDLMRTAANELQVDVSMTGGSLDNDGVASVSFLDTTPNGGSFSFDTFAVRPSGATSTAEIFDTRLFRVQFIIPEPASFVLLGLGGMAIVFGRRRAR
jgi:hypothetical protein